jgi:CTP:molybdopterin cytidylyltransferase MocA
VSVAGLLLAAGAGRRMGLPKALVRVDSELLVERGVRLLRDGGCAPVLVVLGARADDVVAAADLDGATVVRNPGWETGMGSSLRAGLGALTAVEGCEAVVVALVDQPLVGPEAVRRLITAWQEDRHDATVATYRGAQRNPVLLDRRAWPAAAAAAVGDVGARGWLRAPYSAARVVEVACEGTGSPIDVDTPEQLASLSPLP